MTESLRINTRKMHVNFAKCKVQSISCMLSSCWLVKRFVLIGVHLCTETQYSRVKAPSHSLPSATKLWRSCFYKCVSINDIHTQYVYRWCLSTGGGLSQHALQVLSKYPLQQVWGGGAIPECIKGGIPACLVTGVQGVLGPGESAQGGGIFSYVLVELD